MLQHLMLHYLMMHCFHVALAVIVLFNSKLFQYFTTKLLHYINVVLVHLALLMLHDLNVVLFIVEPFNVALY